MAQRNTNGAAYNNNGRKKKKKKKNTARTVVILLVEAVVLVGMLAALWVVTRATDSETGIQKVDLQEEEIVINQAVQENEVMQGYYTVALFGVDSTVGNLTSNTRSDTIMVCSLNLDTKEVHLMSVYRDTYLNLSNDTYSKCNAAYSKGGPQMAISMLNMNLDLDITDFVTVGFKGLMDAIDALGGVWVEIDSEELLHINNYQISIAQSLYDQGVLSSASDYTPVTSTGYQLLDGLQATAYCRIRQTLGDDYKRTERQREVLLAMLDQAQTMDITTLTKLVNNVFSSVYTSIDISDIISLLSDLSSYTVIDEGGFPFEEYRTSATMGDNIGSVVICTDLEAAVTEFHRIFFDDYDYACSEELQEIAAKIYADTSVYVSY
ncbi:MAG: LCP family protein [Lachnospiraceae bacterium]|nr:LCP family protein [Lachnospiraceae bacterium]